MIMAIIENEDFVINVNNEDELTIMISELSREIYRMANNYIKKQDIVIKINLE